MDTVGGGAAVVAAAAAAVAAAVAAAAGAAANNSSHCYVIRCCCLLLIHVSFTTKGHHCSLWPDAKTLDKSKWGYSVIHSENYVSILVWSKDVTFTKWPIWCRVIIKK